MDNQYFLNNKYKSLEALKRNNISHIVSEIRNEDELKALAMSMHMQDAALLIKEYAETSVSVFNYQDLNISSSSDIDNIHYIDNQYTRKAAEIFSSGLETAATVYNKSYNDMLYDMSEGTISAGIVPVKDYLNGFIISFINSIIDNDLRIVQMTQVATEENDVWLALVSKNCFINEQNDEMSYNLIHNCYFNYNYTISDIVYSMEKVLDAKVTEIIRYEYDAERGLNILFAVDILLKNFASVISFVRIFSEIFAIVGLYKNN